MIYDYFLGLGSHSVSVQTSMSPSPEEILVQSERMVERALGIHDLHTWSEPGNVSQLAGRAQLYDWTESKGGSRGGPEMKWKIEK